MTQKRAQIAGVNNLCGSLFVQISGGGNLNFPQRQCSNRPDLIAWQPGSIQVGDSSWAAAVNALCERRFDEIG